MSDERKYSLQIRIKPGLQAVFFAYSVRAGNLTHTVVPSFSLEEMVTLDRKSVV